MSNKSVSKMFAYLKYFIYESSSPSSIFLGMKQRVGELTDAMRLNDVKMVRELESLDKELIGDKDKVQVLNVINKFLSFLDS